MPNRALLLARCKPTEIDLPPQRGVGKIKFVRPRTSAQQNANSLDRCNMASRLGKLSKSDRRQVRNLLACAYERELTEALRELAGQVNDWKNHRINAFDLSDAIHDFHDGIARDLWKHYNSGVDDLILLHLAVERGALTAGEVPRHLRGESRDGTV